MGCRNYDDVSYDYRDRETSDRSGINHLIIRLQNLSVKSFILFCELVIGFCVRRLISYFLYKWSYYMTYVDLD